MTQVGEGSPGRYKQCFSYFFDSIPSKSLFSNLERNDWRVLGEMRDARLKSDRRSWFAGKHKRIK